MNNKLFKGIMPALITPIDEKGRLNADCAEAIMRRLLGAGVDGFYANGATGEGLFLSEQTRMDNAELAVSLCRGKAKLINHVGAVDSMAAMRLARHAGEIGCDAISSLVPNYIRSYTTEQLLDYYRRLHLESGLPVLVYCTNLVGSNPYEFMKRVMEIDGVIGCKYTMFDFYSMQRITQLNGGDINVINGPDEMLICGLTMGADGGIGSTYNLMPKRFLKLFSAFREGRFEEARAVQADINRVISVLLAHDCLPAIKEAFRLMGYDAGTIAYPGKVFTEEESAVLARELTEAGYEL